MVGTYDCRDTLAKHQLSSVRKDEGSCLEIVFVLDHPDYRLEGELSKAKYCLQISQRVHFAGEIAGAVRRLVSCGLVVRRSTLDSGRNVCAFHHQSIICTS